MSKASDWAHETFGQAELGDRRRTRRLVRIAERVAERPAGKVTEVITNPAERQGAYDFLEHHEHVAPEAVMEALFQSTARACGDRERTLAVLDGSSLTLTDRVGTKGFGQIGTYAAQARGLKMLNAVAFDVNGTPLGVAEQRWWVRHERAPRKGYRPAKERESAHWRAVVKSTTQRFEQLAPDTRLHWIMDREADASLLLRTLTDLDVEFTIRSSGLRKVINRGKSRDMRTALRGHRVLARMQVQLPATRHRPARTAHLSVRAANLPIRLRDKHRSVDDRLVNMTVVWAREARSKSHEPIEWLLFTNVDVDTADDACAVVERYTQRWKIEQFHRAWKSGLCRVEDTQLRSLAAVIKWATVLGAVASRAESLRQVAREEPEAPVKEILSTTEVRALVLLKKEIARRTETVTEDGLTVAEAVRWIAELGGYVGNKSSGKPGTTTIGRGLERLVAAAQLIELLQDSGELR